MSAGDVEIEIQLPWATVDQDPGLTATYVLDLDAAAVDETVAPAVAVEYQIQLQGSDGATGPPGGGDPSADYVLLFENAIA